MDRKTVSDRAGISISSSRHAPNLSIALVARVTTPFRQVTTPFLLQLCFDFCQTPLHRVLPLDFCTNKGLPFLKPSLKIVENPQIEDPHIQPASFWQSPASQQNSAHLRASKSISLWAMWTPSWRAISCPARQPNSYIVTYMYGLSHTHTNMAYVYTYRRILYCYNLCVWS